MNYRAGGSLNPLVVSSFPNKSADFLIHELPLPDSLNSIFEPVMTDQATQTGLFRNSVLPDFRLYRSFEIEKSFKPGKLYSELFLLNSDSLAGKSLRLEIELLIESIGNPLQAAIVVEVFDEKRKTLAYEAIDLDQLRPSWDSQNHLFRHVILIHHLPQESKSVLLYFWNKKKSPVKILAGRTDIKISI
jgi:hypothetical protein